jgi:hypothetical protein
MALEWARLLQHQQDDGKLGLTPSFLVGALRRVPGAVLGTAPGRPEMRALLEMMRKPVTGSAVKKSERITSARQMVTGA